MINNCFGEDYKGSSFLIVQVTIYKFKRIVTDYVEAEHRHQLFRQQ